MNDPTSTPDTNTFTANPVPPANGPLPPSAAPAPAGPRPLLRDPNTRLGGVASGVAHYFGLDVSLVRLLFVVFTLMAGWGALAYLAAWIIVPKAETWPPAWPPAPPAPAVPPAPGPAPMEDPAGA
ncbi:MAG: PspC domain-containing protein [Acidimicrobiia bacterium]|nr:PspC domain-containing protein [Acidimicrobiia bacterium]MDH5288868.1 PspC domain-containing protein [Acidimicrobiia bacterium]